MHAFATVKVSYFGSVSNRNLCNFTVVEPDIKRKKSRHMQLQSWSSRVVSEVNYSHPQRIVKSPFSIDYCCKADRQFHLLVRDLTRKGSRTEKTARCSLTTYKIKRLRGKHICESNSNYNNVFREQSGRYVINLFCFNLFVFTPLLTFTHFDNSVLKQKLILKIINTW